MKTLLSLVLPLTLLTPCQAQLKATPVCPPFSVDLLKGHVNDVEPDFSSTRIKQKFPCFSSEELEASHPTCGASVSYKDKDIYFYSGRGYIEIREKFKGQLSIPLMGAARNSLFKWLGYAKIKDVKWDAFQTQYGTLVLHYNKLGKVNRIQFSKKSTDLLSLCE